jgi:hypothetical protein
LVHNRYTRLFLFRMSEYITLLPYIAPISCFHLDRYISICIPAIQKEHYLYLIRRI